jgi:hypothetical protein
MLALSTKQPLYCLSFELRLLITPLVSSNFSDQNNRLSASCFLEQRSLCFHVTLETCHEDNLTGCIYMEVENASQKMGNISFFPFQILLCDLTSTFDRKIWNTFSTWQNSNFADSGFIYCHLKKCMLIVMTAIVDEGYGCFVLRKNSFFENGRFLNLEVIMLSPSKRDNSKYFFSQNHVKSNVFSSP